MAVRTNLGKITASIQEGRKAYSNIDFGPDIPSNITDLEAPIADWGVQTTDPNIFVFGVDRWASTTLRVTK